MTWRHRLPLIAGILTIAAFAQTQTHSRTKTYVSPKGDFQFRYPAWLIDCKADPGDASCASYLPICEGERYESIACIAFPKDRVKGQQTFDGAALVVTIVQNAHDDATCRAIPNPPPDNWAHPHTETINGVDFWVTHNAGVAMSHAEDMAIYRTMHNRMCYELDINIGGISPMVFSNQPQPFDSNKIEKPLRETLLTFEFLK